MLEFSKIPSRTCPSIFWVQRSAGSNTIFVRKTNVHKIRRMCHMYTRFQVSKFLSPDICRRIVSMSVFPIFNSLKFIGFAVSYYIWTFPPSCFRHHGYDCPIQLDQDGVYGYPSPSSSLRCPNSCHGRPQAHKLAPDSFGMTSMTGMTFGGWDVVWNSSQAARRWKPFLKTLCIYFTGLAFKSYLRCIAEYIDFFFALLGVDLRKPWVDQIHLNASKKCSVSEIRILSSGMHLHKDNSYCAPKNQCFWQEGTMSPWFHPLTHLLVSASQCWKMFSRWDSK